MHPKKSKKILIYFFLLILLGSINNIELNNLKFNTTTSIKVSGLNNVNNNIILNDFKKLNLKNLFFIDKKKIIQLLEKNTLIENYSIFKKYPNTLNIIIEKTNFLAKINKDNKIYLVGNNKKLTKSNFSDQQLPFIFGKPEIQEIILIKRIIDESKFSYDQVKNLYYFPSRRWDIELKNKTIIKLSSQNIKQTLDNVHVFFINEKFKNIKIYDARIENKIILND